MRKSHVGVKMMEPDLEAILKQIIKRKGSELLEARDSKQEDRESEVFEEGRNLAFFEMLDSINNILYIYGLSIKDFGSDIDIEDISGLLRKFDC